MTEPDWQPAVFLDPDKLEKTATQPVQPPQEFDSKAVTLADATAASNTHKPPRKRWRWLAVATSGLLGAVVGSELYRFVSWGFDLHQALGIAFLALVGTVTTATVWTLWQSLKGLRQLAKTEALHQQALALQQSQQHGQAQTFLKQLDKHYLDTSLNSEFKEAIRQVDSAYNDGEIIRFISEHALQEQDAAARRCVKSYSVQSGILVALSPYATFDMLLVGWRNLKMLRELAEIYGIAPGAATQWQLLRQVLHNIAFSGLSELMIDAGSQTLGTALTGQISARAAQGVGAGLFTARTGAQAIRLCRPIPLTTQGRLALTALNQQIIQDVSKESIKTSTE